MQKLILGTALLAVIVLVACEEAAGPAAAKHGIEGEWTVTEYLVWNYTSEWIDGELIEELEQVDYINTYAMTLTFLESRWIMTFDPPLNEITSAVVGNYEMLPDSRILLSRVGEASIMKYSMDASTLTLRFGPANREAVLTATRATR